MAFKTKCYECERVHTETLVDGVWQYATMQWGRDALGHAVRVCKDANACWDRATGNGWRTDDNHPLPKYVRKQMDTAASRRDAETQANPLPVEDVPF